MWAMQLTTGSDAGSWEWLDFHNAPWESNESHYWGATLAAVAVGMAPGNYSKTPAIQPGLAALKGYLDRNYDSQPIANRLVVLWASACIPGVLSSSRREELLKEVRHLQRPDGGWSLADLGKWTPRRDKTSFDSRSDGYATGLTVFALQQAGVSVHQPEMKHAIQWLVSNQDAAQGFWPAYSLNKERDLSSDVGRFMSDAATSYAVMALETVQR
jgi:squalene-hopene/tetraprenyl-beta-curcumene cyclase